MTSVCYNHPLYVGLQDLGNGSNQLVYLCALGHWGLPIYLPEVHNP